MAGTQLLLLLLFGAIEFSFENKEPRGFINDKNLVEEALDESSVPALWLWSSPSTPLWAPDMYLQKEGAVPDGHKRFFLAL